MSRLVKLLVTGLVMTLSLLLPSLPAQAADTGAARAAARWVATQVASIDHPSTAADALIALAAGQDPTTADEVSALVSVIRDQGADYVDGSPESAAKLAIALDAVGQDPRTFLPGTDLIAQVAAGVAEDGSFGAYVSPFSLGLGATALERAGQPVPTALVTKLLTYQVADGGFSYAPDGPSDADMTALGLLGLLAADTDASRPAVAKVIDWAAATRSGDGSYPGYNVVNATAILGASLASAGQDTSAEVAFLVSRQQGSGAFLNGDKEDLMATNQAALLLAGVSYLDAEWALSPTATPSPSATPTGSHAPTPTPTPSGSASPVLPVPGPSLTPSVSPSASHVPSATPTRTTLPIPARPSATVTATATATSSAAPAASRTPALTPAAQGGPDRLPQTGTATEPWFIAAALVLLLAGAGLLLARRYAR